MHFHDNKVLPTSLGPDQARAEKSWWYDPQSVAIFPPQITNSRASSYIIRDLNVNSAIAHPDHDEVVDTKAFKSTTYNLEGYAYAGGGRRVNRVELTLDDGKTWQLANISYLEDQFREAPQLDPVYDHLDLTESDQCFCWCFWSLEIPILILHEAPSIAVRAMDESLALQPRNMYWNATGMMNNWCAINFPPKICSEACFVGGLGFASIKLAMESCVLNTQQVRVHASRFQANHAN